MGLDVGGAEVVAGLNGPSAAAVVSFYITEIERRRTTAYVMSDAAMTWKANARKVVNPVK